MATTLNQWEAGPFNAGVNRSMLASEIDDNECFVIQDMFLDIPGELRTRGHHRNVTQNTATFNSTTKRVRGMFSTVDPSGASQLATVTQDSASTNLYFTALSTTGNAPGISLTLDSGMPIASDCLVDAKPALGGGLWVGTQELPSAGAIAGRQCLFHWRGATKATYSTGTISATLGSPIVTGSGTSWTANLAPGMFLLYGAKTGIYGVIKSVDSNTQVTLEKNVASSSVGGQPYVAQSIRGWTQETSKGRISVAVGSTSVIGSGTNFQSSGVAAAAANVYRARDETWLGSFAGATGEEGATLGVALAAGKAMDNEPYIARYYVQVLDTYLIPTSIATGSGAYPGVLNATYAGLQWFARQDGPTPVGTGDMHSRLWFSDYRNMNSIDLATADGDYLQIPSSAGQNFPIRAIAPSVNALLIFKENETFAITGDSPDTFALNKIWDDGCLSSMSVVTAHGTVIWAGRQGIYQYDGAKVVNLVARSLGQTWKDWVKYFDPRIHKMVGAFYQDHYFISVVSKGSGSFTPTLYSALKNGVETAVPINCAMCIRIPTQALTFITQMSLCGYASTNSKTYYSTSPGDYYICDFDQLFSFPSAVDYNSNAAFFPDPFVELKRMSMKDPLRKKGFKQVIATMDSTRAVLMEIAPNLISSTLSTAWTLVTSSFPANASVPTTTRLKFLKRHQFLGVKFYCDTTFTYGYFNLRRVSVDFKWQRVGRI